MDKNIFQQINQELLASSEQAFQECSSRYFKEPVKIYGVRIGNVGKIAREFIKKLAGKNKQEIFSLCEQLWQTGYMEDAIIACDFAYSQRKNFTPDDFQYFERWIGKYISNWAECDTFCNYTMGFFLHLYPEFIKNLLVWTLSGNRWLRRAAAVSLIILARRGEFLTEVFKIADKLLLDKDDLVQKGYGWLLKEASKPYQQEVFRYVMRHKHNMPRTALRYAIEKMPVELRAKAMAK